MNWNLICYLLEDFSILKKRNHSFRSADYLYFMDQNSEDLENTVYISDGSVPSRSFEKSLIILIGKQTVNSRNYIMLSGGTPAQVLNRLLEAKQHLDQLASRLSCATGNQEVIDIAGEFLGRPLFYFDASYRVLAITDNVDFTEDKEWEHMKEKGFLSLESIRIMQESGDLDLLADKRDPFPFYTTYYPYPSLVCNIWNHDIFYSRLNMLCIDHAPDELGIQECRILCAALLRIALSSGGQDSYTGPLNSMVLDLLRGLQLSEELIIDRLRTVPRLPGSLAQVCCIESNVKNDPQVLYYYRALVEQMFESDNIVTLVFDGKLILILHAPDENAFHPLYQKLTGLLETQGLRCGVSSLFQKFGTLREHYIQALTTLSISSRKQGIVFFREIYFDYILSFIPREQAIAMVSNGIIRLIRHQDSYQFPLIDTLRIYLDNGCNLQRTAKHLFIHKNTALYRLNHIREILDMDLEDAGCRMELLFSVKIIEKYGLAI